VRLFRSTEPNVAIRGRQGEIEELEHARDTLLESYKAIALEELNHLTPEEHHGFFRTLRMIVYAHPEGGVELRGEFLPFGRVDNGEDAATRGFSTNKDTQGYGAGARVLQLHAAPRRWELRVGSRTFRLLAGCRGRPRAARPPCLSGI
jgi:hypothetical protein